jgi:hypothetical protein
MPSWEAFSRVKIDEQLRGVGWNFGPIGSADARSKDPRPRTWRLSFLRDADCGRAKTCGLAEGYAANAPIQHGHSSLGVAQVRISGPRSPLCRTPQLGGGRLKQIGRVDSSRG